jgi:PD-(D/E)XK nuclease superfamily protein
MKEHPKAVGDRSSLAVMLGLHEAEIAFFLPVGENSRCDFVIERGRELARVQCKSGRLRRGAVEFATCSWYGHHPNPKQISRDYLDEVDYFAVYCRETSGVYLIPIGDVQTRCMGKLRVDPPRNNQRRQSGLQPTTRSQR